MPLRIEDYGLIGDTQTAALVGSDGSIDWMCVPRFDSGAVFAGLLGTPDHGRWLLAPAGGVRRVERAYHGDTLVLETTFHTDDGVVRISDFMPIRTHQVELVRIVEGVSGRVPMHMDLRIRFDYGSIVPWVRKEDHRLRAIAGPDALVLNTPVDLVGADQSTVAEFVVEAGDAVPFVMAWHPSHEEPPRTGDGLRLRKDTITWWKRWAAQATCAPETRDLIMRSLITLKALTYAPTGGIVAAPTTSLPEWIGSVRNWDYRYCWLRDSVLTLGALMAGGYKEEAFAWRDWLLRAAAGDPADLQIMYGVQGERRLTEFEVDWLPGYEGSAPVRVGNAAHGQFQLDVYGETLGSLHLMRLMYPPEDDPTMNDSWPLETALLEYLEGAWHHPDDGIWEVRGGRQHFTHSKVMAWLAFSCAVASAERFDLPAPVDRWRQARDDVHALVCAEGYDPDLGSFTQAFGSRQLDGALLQLPLVGFLPPTDERIRGTVAAIERELLHDGFVLRYRSDQTDDGLPAGEGVFLPCSFWLVDNYVVQGRTDEAWALYRRLASLANDVGLFSEEYDPASGRALGNMPQAFTHLAGVRAAQTLTGAPPRTMH
ncbi:MAG: glycoside hydrolase family 15 protein [Actinobacteria bacterium]|nr:glycoside hydrolase family 15 protein [Actinomycetota bacterium]